MNRTKVFQGEIVEDGNSIVKGELDVYATEFEISIHKHTEHMFRGKSLIISPFNRKMFWGSAVEQGYQISMQGNSLGSYKNGPKGHPGDGEYDIYEVTQVSISGIYEFSGLNVIIEVATGIGSDVCFSANEESEQKLQSKKVVAKFHVPKPELKDFLGLNNIEHFIQRIEASA